ncbi:septum formation protein Maf [Salinisphaera sp. USBA-960]|nr:septum formation protein Maf [Salifodinibacter halophilus]NNC26982.1 septum formation protein Maf [Salifodinibacter halophilus]
MRLLLASGSARRAEILDTLGIEFDIQPADIDESARAGEAPDALCRRLATQKAETVHASAPDATIIGADTLVAFGGEALGKPRDAEHGRSMLAAMSGTTHRVHTAMTVIAPPGTVHEHLSTSVVTLRALAAEEITAYWATGEPIDKAGGYAIQGIGGAFVEHLDGSASAVAGLDCCQIVALLRAAGVAILGQPTDAAD